MTPALLGRRSVEQWLADLVEGSTPIESFRSWIGTVLVGNEVRIRTPDKPLLTAIFEELDFASGSEEKVRELSFEYLTLLRTIHTNESAELLVKLIPERQRLCDLIRKRASGIVSNTGFLAFLAEQRWPDYTRKRLASLPASELNALDSALSTSDYAAVGSLLDT